MNVINNKIDLHKAKAAELFGVPMDEVTSAQRQHDKHINYCYNYGSSMTDGSKKLSKVMVSL